MANPVLGKSLCSDWFFLGQDFAVRTGKRSNPCIFALEQSRQIQNLQPKQRKKTVNCCHPSQRNYQKKLKRLKIFRNFKDGWRRRTFSKRVLLSWRYLETFDVEKETGITESQETIDDFINQQKSTNTNKKTATDMNTLLLHMEANGIKNQKIESLPCVRAWPPFVEILFWTHARKMEKSTSQQQFPGFSAVYSDT